MKGLQNFLEFINANYVSILICIGLIIGFITKVKNFMVKSDEEKIEIAKKQIQATILRLITSAEMDFAQWNEAGEIKRAQTIQAIYQAFPIISKAVDQESMIAFIDEQIEESLKTLRKIVKENDGVPTPTA